MKISRVLFAAALALGIAANANAAIVNTSGPSVDLGTVSVGASGMVTVDAVNGVNTGALFSSIYGVLSSNSMIEFTYTPTGSVFSGYAAAYAGIDAGAASGFTGLDAFAPPPDASSSSPLIFASAQLDVGTGVVTMVIKNFSSGVANFNNVWSAIVSRGAQLTATYQVSAVPLPAALPLFAFGLAGLAGVGYRKKKALAA